MQGLEYTSDSIGKVTLEYKRPWAALTVLLPPTAHCDSVSGVLECRLEEGRRRPREEGRNGLKWDLVGGLCPPGGARKAQWVRRATKTPFTLVRGKINLFLRLPCPLSLAPPQSPPPDLR